MSEIALVVDDVHKQFVLPHERHSSMKAILMGRRDRTFDLQRVLRGVSFEIRRGEFFGIVGRNGSGKSTLLKLLAEIYQPTSGRVTRHGSIMPLIELGVGFNPELTGRQNVYLNGAMIGFSRRQMDDMYDDIVAFAGIERFMDQKLKNYSSGMQVRLAFSIATRVKADILLIDEVLAVGDADFQRKCLAYFSDLKHSETTVVFVTHSMEAVRQYCDRAILLEEGEIVVAGDAEEVAQAYTRLFSPADVDERPARGDRWGSGGASFGDVSVPAEFTDLDDEIVVAATLTPAPGFDRRVRPDFVVRDRTGRQVFGTRSFNATEAKQHERRLMSAARITWRVPNVLNTGDYTVSLQIHDAETHDVIEQWDFAAKFAVNREPRTPYLMTPPISVEIIE